MNALNSAIPVYYGWFHNRWFHHENRMGSFATKTGDYVRRFVSREAEGFRSEILYILDGRLVRWLRCRRACRSNSCCLGTLRRFATGVASRDWAERFETEAAPPRPPAFLMACCPIMDRAASRRGMPAASCWGAFVVAKAAILCLAS